MMKTVKMIKTDYRDRRIIRELHKPKMISIKMKESKREPQLEKERGKAATYHHCYSIYTKNKL